MATGYGRTTKFLASQRGELGDCTSATDDVASGGVHAGRTAFPCPACHVLEGGVAAALQNAPTEGNCAKDVTMAKESGDDVKKTTSWLTDDVTATHTSTSVPEVAQEAGSVAIAFHAKRLDKAETRLLRPIVFRDVTVNEGGGYDSRTGVFTAPAPGLYVFSAALKKAGGRPGGVTADVMKNGAALASLCASSASTGSCSVSVRLRAGQTVWVKAGSAVEDYADRGSANFTGTLVQSSARI